MRPLFRSFIALSLAAALGWPAAAANVKIKTGGAAGAGAAGSVGAVGAQSRTPLPVPQLSTGLSLPSAPSAQAPLAAPTARPHPSGALEADVALPAAAASPAGAAAARPAGDETVEAAAASPIDEQRPALEGLQAIERRAAETTAGDEAAGAQGQARQGGPDLDLGDGAALFDGARAQYVLPTHRPSLGERIGGAVVGLRNLLRAADRIPARVEPGGTVRVGQRSFRVDSKLSEEGGIARYATRSGGDFAILLLDENAAAAHDAEREALAQMRADGVPHLRVVAVSVDGRAVVQEYNSRGPEAAEVLASGRTMPSMGRGWIELAAALLRAGRVGDVRAENLTWAIYGSRWQFKNGRGYAAAAPADILARLLDHPLRERLEVTPLELLRGLRGRLGPDKALWRRLAADGPRDARLAAAFAELAAFDAAHRGTVRLAFARDDAAPRFSNELLSPRGLRRALGFDPNAKQLAAYHLHGDDPGKLNTQVYALPDAPGGEVVRKIAEERIIRNELMMRKVVARFFGRYFTAPSALAARNGFESIMVMEKAAGSGATLPRMSREQHAALGVLANAFGIYDMNPGNVLYGQGGVVLIDFEQALSRRGPVPDRLPDPSILQELPWVNRPRDPMMIEDFFGAVADWRAEFAKPQTQAEIRGMLAESGFSPADSEAVMASIAANTSMLTATLQADVDFAAERFRR